MNNSTYQVVRGLNDFFGDFFNETYNWTSAGGSRSSRVKKEDGGYSASVELPGYNKETLSIKVENGNLLVVRSGKEDEKDKILDRLELSNDVDRKKIKAKSEDGILRLSLPKLEEKKNTCIMIE